MYASQGLEFVEAELKQFSEVTGQDEKTSGFEISSVLLCCVCFCIARRIRRKLAGPNTGGAVLGGGVLSNL